MEEMISYCGLNCLKCPAFKATVENSAEKRARVATRWSKIYNAELKAEDIVCDGCTVGKRTFHHCRVCEIRICGIKEKVKNCAFCKQYPCDKLKEFHKHVPSAGTRLKKIYKSI